MTLSVLRLVKEEASYYKELQQQEARIQKLEPGDENAEFILKQEVCGSRVLPRHNLSSLLFVEADTSGYRSEE
jgi:hypothetical protein